MKRIFCTLIFGLLVGSSPSFSALPNHANINFTLSQDKGSCPALLDNARVVIDYDYNFERNMGLAHLRELQSAHWSEDLHPLGLKNYYAFMSSMQPKTIQLDGGEVTVYRIIFHLYNNGDSKAFLMIGKDGSCIMASNIVNVNS